MADKKAIINEMAELFLSPDNMEKDIIEAFGLMKEHLHKKYTQKVYSAFDACHSTMRENPPPEVKLLAAWKPFIPQESHAKINEFVDMLQKINALREIRDGMGSALAATCNDNGELRTGNIHAAALDNTAAYAKNDNPSVHPDGVYDIDESCYYNSAGGDFGMDRLTRLFMLCAFMNR